MFSFVITSFVWWLHHSFGGCIVQLVAASFAWWLHHLFGGCIICLVAASCVWRLHHLFGGCSIRFAVASFVWLAATFVWWLPHVFGGCIVCSVAASFDCWLHHLFGGCIICFVVVAQIARCIPRPGSSSSGPWARGRWNHADGTPLSLYLERRRPQPHPRQQCFGSARHSVDQVGRQSLDAFFIVSR